MFILALIKVVVELTKDSNIK
ncbi:hypothetical protein N2E53_04450 [Leuconostoc citreum]